MSVHTNDLAARLQAEARRPMALAIRHNDRQARRQSRRQNGQGGRQRVHLTRKEYQNAAAARAAEGNDADQADVHEPSLRWHG